MRPLLLLVPTLLMASCSSPSDATASGGTSDHVSAEPVAPRAEPTRASARKVDVKNDHYSFFYEYPAAAAAIPSLKSRLDADIDKQRGKLVAATQECEADNEKDVGTCNFPYSWSAGLEVVTSLPNWLSLSVLNSAYYGGAHPNSWFASILWDRQADRERDPRDLFVSREALTQAIQPEFCRQLDKQRTEKRGEPVERGEDFDDGCPNPLESTIILGSSNGKAFNRIGVLVNPYVAGSYFEGDFEATIPVNAAILATVKPEFRSSFAIAR